MKKKFFFKKGDIDKDYLIYLVLFVVLLFVFILFLGKFRETAVDRVFDEACHQYLHAHVFSRKIFGDSISGGNKNPCRTQDVVFESTRKYDVMNDLARVATDCYNTFYRGEENLFTGEPGETTSFCAICHKIEFEEDVNEDGINTKELIIENFEWNGFLASVKYKTGEEYMKILSGEGYFGMFKRDPDLVYIVKDEHDTSYDIRNHIVFNTSNDYITLFVFNKTQELGFWQQIGRGAITGGLIATGVVVGGAVLVLSGGTALPILATITGSSIAIVGGTTAGAGVAFTKAIEKGGSKWQSSIEIVQYDVETLKKIKCDHVVGMTGYGIENKPY